MFNSIIGTFLKPQTVGLKEKVLNLELLSYNFHEALDLAPLFQDVYREIDESSKSPAHDSLKRRLERAAEEVKSKQIAALEDAGRKQDITINLRDLEQRPEGIKVIDGPLSSPLMNSNGVTSLPNAHFKVEALLVDQKKRQIRIKLEVRTPRTGSRDLSEDETDTTYSVFWITPFDFPMINNTRLPYGQRCAIVLRRFGNPVADLTLVTFPGSRASLKEKPFFDDAMREILLARRQLLNEQKTR